MPVLVRISEGAISTNNLLSENSGLLFVIRPPQRRFKWKRQQIDQLWNDIVNAHTDKRDSYFLGTLLLIPLEDDPHVSVIDGQQRITTLSLLLAVLRDYCRGINGLETRADGIQRLISRVDNDGRPVGSLVVTLQDPDNQTYEKLVKEPGSTRNLTAVTSNLLTDAVKRLTECVDGYINVPERQERLRGLCEYVQSSVKFLPLEVRSESEGYMVFDTTNTRGMRLSPSEALKANLATTAAREDGDLAEKLIGIWDDTAGTLEDSGLSVDAMDGYIHAILCARQGSKVKRTLDPNANKLTKPDDIKDFVKYLELYCDSYLAVVKPSGESSLCEDLKDLVSRLNVVQSNSFLTMVHKHSRNRFQESVSLVLSLQIRNITIGPFQANEYEQQWPQWAKLVREGQVEMAFQEIRGRIVSDEEFQKAFEAAEVSAAGTARHLLRRLDPISQPGSGVQPMDVDVEHILPKSVVSKLAGNRNLTAKVKKWIEDLDYDIPNNFEEKINLAKELLPFVNKLGNQALLNLKANRALKDSPFSDKKDFYKKQALKLTKSLENYGEWKLGQILNRQKEMAKKAPQIWPK